MLEMFGWSSGKTRLTLLVLAAFQVAGCGSPEDRARTYYEHGIKLFADHENAKASIELRNAVRLKKDLIGAWRALAQIDEINRNWGGVVTDLRTIVELDPNDVSARLKLGKLQLLAGSPDEALSLVNAGIELDNRNSDLHALKAAASLRLDDQVAAVREAQAAIEVDPGNADALTVLAVDRLRRGDGKGALSLLEGEPVADAKHLQNNLGLQLLKIKIFEQSGDLKSAEATLKKLVELNPQGSGYRKLLITFYLEQGRTNDAEMEMRALAAANPTDSAAALDLVRFLYTIRKAPAAARQELNARISAGGEVFPYRMALADMDLAEGNLSDGTQLLESLISAGGSPEHVLTARIALAQVYLSKRDFDPAEALATDVLREDRQNASGLKLRASIHLERGQLDAAVADLLEALNYQPRSTELMSLLGTAYERNGLIELAEKQYADATRASYFDAVVGLEYVAFLQRRGSIGRAEDILVELNKRRPNNIQILSALAQVRLARQNWGGAQEIAESIRRISNGGGVADQILGAALVGRNKYDEAIAAFQSAYNAAPTAAQPMASLIGSFLKANKKDQAMAFLKAVLDKNPGNANALVLLGSIQLTSGIPDQALRSFTAAVKAEPKNIVGYQALAQFYVSQKKHDEAITVIRTGIQEQADIFALRLILANLLEQKGDYDAAISEYESMLSKQPGNLVVVNNLASLLSDHRTDKASLEKAQALAASLRKSQIPQFKDTLGWVSYRQGDYKTAVSLIEEAATALPDQASVRYHLGMGYISTGQLTKASGQLTKALELAPNGELAVHIRTALEKAGSQITSPSRH
jgi:tetratricopeptide (TPR) repeat protein